MKRSFFSLFTLIFLVSCTVSKQKVLTQVDTLLTQKKYESAYALLEKADPKNLVPDMVLEKVQIALDDYIFTENLKIFCFKDIAIDQNVEDFRGQKGTYTRYTLNPEEALSGVLQKFPEDWRLYKALGEYDYQLYLNHDKLEADKGLARLKLAQSYFYQASIHQAADSKSYYHLGLVDLYLQDYKSAEESFKTAIQLGNNTGDNYYNLAFTQYNLGEIAPSVDNAEKALNLYRTVPEKALCAHLLALAAMSLRDENGAIKYFELIHSFQPQDYEALKTLLTLYLKHGTVDKVLPIAQAMLAIQPSNASILQDIYGVYLQYGRVNEFYDFLHQMIFMYAHQDAVLGNLYFYQANADLLVNHKKSARTSLKMARIFFTKVLPPTDEMFQIIQNKLTELTPVK
jgi:tetratricopeptide (TPR) repeat protein